MVQWLERAVVGNLLTTLVFAGMSKNSGSILLSTQYKAKNNVTTSLYNQSLYTLELDHGPLPIDGTHFPKSQSPLPDTVKHVEGFFTVVSQLVEQKRSSNVHVGSC